MIEHYRHHGIQAFYLVHFRFKFRNSVYNPVMLGEQMMCFVCTHVCLCDTCVCVWCTLLASGRSTNRSITDDARALQTQ